LANHSSKDLIMQTHKFVGDHTAESRLSTVHVSESQVAGNLVLHADDRTTFESAGKKFIQVGSQFGFTVSIKGLVMDAGEISPRPAVVRSGHGMIEMAKNFTYLSSNLSSNCEAMCEVNRKL